MIGAILTLFPEAVRPYLDESILGIAQRLDLNRSTVYWYLRGQPESGAVRTRHVGSMLDVFLPYLCQRWSEG